MVPNPIFFKLKKCGFQAYNVIRKKNKTNPGIKITRRSNMFFKSRKKEEKVEEKKVEVVEKEEKKELLYRENIRVGCGADTQENVIRQVGQMLVDTGYVDAPYVDAMIEREKSFSTFMGNGLALPHGVEAAKKEIKASGIAVMTFPEGIDWAGNTVNVVIGIAGVGEEHLEILAVIADKMLDDEVSQKLATCDADTVYQILAGKE